MRITSIASLNEITEESREPTTWPTEDNSNSQQNTLHYTLKVFLWLSGLMRVLGNHDADLLELKFLLFKTKQSANNRGSRIDCSGAFRKLTEIVFSASPAKIHVPVMRGLNIIPSCRSNVQIATSIGNKHPGADCLSSQGMSIPSLSLKPPAAHPTEGIYIYIYMEILTTLGRDIAEVC